MELILLWAEVHLEVEAQCKTQALDAADIKICHWIEIVIKVFLLVEVEHREEEEVELRICHSVGELKTCLQLEEELRMWVWEEEPRIILQWKEAPHLRHLCFLTKMVL